jgi:hypothetical protein
MRRSEIPCFIFSRVNTPGDGRNLRLPDGLAFHVDRQFRLLREDMLRDLREDNQVALMIKKGRCRGLCVENLSMYGEHLITPDGIDYK